MDDARIRGRHQSRLTARCRRQAVLNGSRHRHEARCLCDHGPLGSGKSTMMNILGCTVPPAAGPARRRGRAVGGLTDNQRPRFATARSASVFQSLPTQPCPAPAPNVELPLVYAQRTGGAVPKALAGVGLGPRGPPAARRAPPCVSYLGDGPSPTSRRARVHSVLDDDVMQLLVELNEAGPADCDHHPRGRQCRELHDPCGCASTMAHRQRCSCWAVPRTRRGTSSCAWLRSVLTTTGIIIGVLVGCIRARSALGSIQAGFTRNPPR